MSIFGAFRTTDLPHQREVEILNEMLAEIGGRFHDGRPFWRIVWANNQYEQRKGMFDVYHDETGIWLERKWFDCLRVAKYGLQLECHGKWILEKLHFDDTWDVVNEGPYRYNCLVIFQGPNKEYEMPNMRICRMAIHTWKNKIERKPFDQKSAEDTWMADQVEKNLKHIHNQPDKPTINWKPVQKDIHDLGSNKLTKR